MFGQTTIQTNLNKSKTKRWKNRGDNNSRSGKRIDENKDGKAGGVDMIESGLQSRIKYLGKEEK